MLRSGLFFDPYSAGTLFAACALCPFSSIDYAVKVFDQIPQPSIYIWNTLIRALALGPEPIQCLLVFERLLCESLYVPNKFTFPFVIKAAAALGCLGFGRAVHGMAVKASFGSDLFILNSLVNCYASCGGLDLACLVFEKIEDKDVVSWNSMIKGFVHGGCPDRALELFRRMEVENVKPDRVTLVGVLSACSKEMDLEFGKRVIENIEGSGIDVDLTLSNAMLDMFVKCGSLEDARRLFDNMVEKDTVSWTTMIHGYAKMDDYDSARSLFVSMPRKDIAAWNVLISAYEQNGKAKDALAVFRELQSSKVAIPDEITLLSTLSACAQLGAMDLGRWIHEYMKKEGFKLKCHLASALIDMYSKCGDLEMALKVFYSVDRKDVFVWSTMIGGLAMHGHGRAAIDLFSKMQEAKVKPNSVTFTNLLCACSYTGLVEEGRMFFRKMEPVYGVVPEMMHYTCMADLLGRAGNLEEAFQFIEKMPLVPSASLWGLLLGACRIHENGELAEKACNHLLNTCAKPGKGASVSGLRKQTKDYRPGKEHGCSSIEADGIIHDFPAGDNSHPLSNEIYTKLDEIADRLKAAGYQSQLQHFGKEENMREPAFILHSEMLAIAFGFISMEPTQPIRVVTNLRICGDCHSDAKLISKLYNRDVLLRDASRFHHFRGGQCSCMNYW